MGVRQEPGRSRRLQLRSDRAPRQRSRPAEPWRSTPAGANKRARLVPPSEGNEARREGRQDVGALRSTDDAGEPTRGTLRREGRAGQRNRWRARCRVGARSGHQGVLRLLGPWAPARLPRPEGARRGAPPRDRQVAEGRRHGGRGAHAARHRDAAGWCRLAAAANVYLHEVLDRWFATQVRPRLVGRATLIRYADDFVIAFSSEVDARRVSEVLPKRSGKYGLTLHPEKTRLVKFRRPSSPDGGKRDARPGPSTCSASRMRDPPGRPDSAERRAVRERVCAREEPEGKRVRATRRAAAEPSPLPGTVVTRSARGHPRASRSTTAPISRIEPASSA